MSSLNGEFHGGNIKAAAIKVIAMISGYLYFIDVNSLVDCLIFQCSYSRSWFNVIRIFKPQARSDELSAIIFV